MTIDRHYTPHALAQVGAQLLRRHVAPAARIRQAGNGWVPLCAAVAFELLSQDLEDSP